MKKFLLFLLTAAGAFAASSPDIGLRPSTSWAASNIMAATNYANVRTNLNESGRFNAQRLDPTPLLSIPQKAILANLPVDRSDLWRALTGTTITTTNEVLGSSLETRVLTTNVQTVLRLIPDGTVTQTGATFTNLAAQDWHKAHFLVHAYIEDSPSAATNTAANFSNCQITLYDSATGSTNAVTLDLGSALVSEDSTNGFYYHGSIPAPYSTNSPNTTFGNPPPNMSNIWRLQVKFNYNTANIAVPIRVGSITVAKPPSSAGKLCFIFDQTKANGLIMASQLNRYGMRATWAVQTNSSYQDWSKNELDRLQDMGHGMVLYGNDTVTTTDLADWVNTRVIPTKEWAYENGFADLRAWVYGGSGSATYPLRHGQVVRDYYRPLLHSAIYSSETKSHSPYFLYNIVRYQEWTATAQYPSTVSSGSIVSNTIYYVKSTGTVTYDGNTYQIGDIFRGSGTTTYTGSGLVCAASTWHKMYHETTHSSGMAAVLIHAHSRSSDLDDFQSFLDEIVWPDVQAGRVEVVSLPDIFREARNGWPKVAGNAVADATGAGDVVTQLNALLLQLRKMGVLYNQ